jgi:hypothetical protein
MIIQPHALADRLLRQRHRRRHDLRTQASLTGAR